MCVTLKAKDKAFLIVIILSIVTISSNHCSANSDTQKQLGSISGNIIKGESITISGSGFGGGPTVSLYDTADGVLAQAQALNDPMIGEYYSVKSYYESGGRDGGSCLRVIDGTGHVNPFFHQFGEDVTEVFVSYWYRHVAGSYFPSPFVSAPDIYPDLKGDSCLKPSWLMYGDRGDLFKNDTIFMEHWAGGGSWGLTGNDRNIWRGVGGKAPDWFVFGNWIRKTLYIKADPDNPDSANGRHYMHFMNSNTPASVFEKNDIPTFDEDRAGDEPAAWDRIKFVPWARGGAPGEVQHQMDDIYVAINENAAARLELGDAPNYDSCVELVICPTTFWSDDKVIATVEVGSLDTEGDVWAFLTLADNVTRYSWQVLSGGVGGASKGDINQDGDVDLVDVVIGLQIISGKTQTIPQVENDIDVNSDGKIGLSEVLHALQSVKNNAL